MKIALTLLMMLISVDAIAAIRGGGANSCAATFEKSETRAPIRRFSQVSANVFRGARPSPEGLRWLAESGVKTILNLDNDRPAVERERELASELGLRFISIPMSYIFIASDENVNRALSILDSTDIGPVFVHCQRGMDRTGLIVGLYRIEKQNWPAVDAFDEMLRFGYHSSIIGLHYYFAVRAGFYMPDLTLSEQL